MSGWANSTRRARLPRDWATRRYQTLRRDSWRCVKCGRLATDVDHITAGDNHSMSNLQSLCADHHREKTQAEAVAGTKARHARLKLPTEDHPGIIRNANDPDTPRG